MKLSWSSFWLPGISTTLALASGFYQRIGPIHGFVGTECGNPQNKCYEPVLNGGFPLPYIVDRPTISIPGHLFVEDDIRIWAFLIDIAFYLVVLLVVKTLFRRQGDGI